MEALTLALSITALILSIFALAAGGGAIVTVIGWSRSTHAIQYVKPPETTFTRDLPAGVEDLLPSPPEALTAEEYARRLLREAEMDPYSDS